ncbi:hypothetical protein AB9P05_19705 [Roseivirga sp. BDSF3-8]|uniref:hypothetical protein n=1 Tax=Roseivirga sp. BDSF3-8 TaxID=3241598 RepID=UPI003531E641
MQSKNDKSLENLVGFSKEEMKGFKAGLNVFHQESLDVDSRDVFVDEALKP